MNNELIQVAKIGRLVGLRGELKLHIQCDFPEQFHPNATFLTDKDFKLEINTVNEAKKTVSFKGFLSRVDAAKLVNINLFVIEEESEKNCHLKEGEFFWYDIINSKIKENDKILGIVEDIERISANDYLIVKTASDLVELGLPKLFYIPYISRYIIEFRPDEKIVYTKDSYGILENS